MQIEAFGLSDVGKNRTLNEDNICFLPEEKIFIVADGLGGHSSGEVASAIAVNTVRDFILDSKKDADITWAFGINPDLSWDTNRVLNGIRLANQKIFLEGSSDLSKKNMASTIVVVVITDNEASIAHVGDSRIYLFNGNVIQQISNDHSLVAEQLKDNLITNEEASNSNYKNVITRALGIKETVEADFQEILLDSGTYLLLCSDGLTNMLNDQEISAIVTDLNMNLTDKCETLINKANENGGIDNISVVLIQCSHQNSTD